MFSVVRDGGCFNVMKSGEKLAGGLDNRSANELLRKLVCLEEMKFKGENGRDGKDGRDGVDGIAGRDGKDGVDGRDGKDGRNGVDGRDGKDGKDGVDGANGRDGVDGKDGRFYVMLGRPSHLSSGMIFFDMEDKKLKVVVGETIMSA